LPETKFNISIIGTGNLARHLCHLFSSSYQVNLIEIAGRNPVKTHLLAQEFQIKASSLESLVQHDGIYFFAVADNILPELIDKTDVPGSKIYCSGSVELNQIGKSRPLTGVFYLLQSFSYSKLLNDYSEIPVFIESENRAIEKMLHTLGHMFFKKVLLCNSQQRAEVHFNAVFTANFIHHLLSLSGKRMRENGLDIELLKPLIAESIEKGMQTNAFDLQTGPARRKDYQIIAKHIKLIEKDQNLLNIYNAITQSIFEHYKSTI
jgi:predicted short-subunit dehydrogenase-like oxidoreductase (DUF2520 family)